MQINISYNKWTAETEDILVLVFEYHVFLLFVSLVCAQEAVKLMREKEIDDGHIINLSSMSGHHVYPNAVSHFYSATKYAVTALTIGQYKMLH